MTCMLMPRVRKLLIALIAAAILLAWPLAPAYAGPDTGEPRGPKPRPYDEDEELLLPAKWNDHTLLIQAAVELNSRLAQSERRHLVPWRLAAEIRSSLLAGKALVPRIDLQNQPAYYQALFFSSLAAGYPADAAAAVRALLKLDDKKGWNWLSLYRASMLTGDKTACLEAAERVKQMFPADKAAALEYLARDVAAIGQSPDCQLPLSNGTTINPARCTGNVLVIDLFLYNNTPSREAMPVIRNAWLMFKDYPGFRMIGVNMDKRESKPSVLAYIKAKGIDWPVHFEQATERPISGKLLCAWQVPTEIVVSPSGRIIFSGMPNDPLFYYAVRAGLVQANKGQVPTSQPGADDSGFAEPEKPVRPTQPIRTGPVGGDDAAQKAERDKRANQKMKVAEAFLAAGSVENALRVYKEVLRDYPESAAAVHAKLNVLKLEGEPPPEPRR